MQGSRLHGRIAEVAALRRLLDETSAGRARAALIEGVAGIGKTRLVEEIAADAHARGFEVFIGSADELESNRPYGPLAEAFACRTDSTDPARAEIARLLKTEQEPGRTDFGIQFRVLDAFVDLVEATATTGRVLIVLEDLHWADPSTVLAFRSIGRRLAFLPIALVGTYRPSPHLRELERMETAVSSEGGLHVLLDSLEDEAVEALVTDSIGSQPGDRLRASVAGAGGNPLFVIELLKALQEEGAITTEEGPADIREISLPPTLRLTILRRISFLPEETLDVLRIAAILGATFSPSELSAVMHRPAIDLVQALREALRGGLLEESGSALRFRHELIREAIYHDLPEGLRAGIHVEAARALAAAGSPTLRVAQHFAIGSSPGDPEAISWLWNAAREAAAGAPVAGIELMQRAHELMAASDPGRVPIQLELAALMTFSGRAPEGEAIIRDVLANPHEPSLEGSLRLILVETLLIQARWREVVSEIEAATKSANVHAKVRGRLLAEGALARFFCGDLDGGWADGQEAVRLGTLERDDLAVSLGLTHLSAIAGGRAQLLESVELAERGLGADKSEEARRDGALRRTRHAFERRDPHFPLAVTLMDVDRFDEAERRLREGQRIAEETGRGSSLPVYHTLLGLRRWYQGEWDDAVAEIEAGLVLAEEIGSHTMGLAARCVIALIAAHRDDIDSAAEAAAAAEAIVERAGPQWNMWLLTRSQALLAEARGTPTVALEILGKWWDIFGDVGNPYSQIHLALDVARLATKLGDRARADLVSDVTQKIADRAPVPMTEGVARYCRGLIADDADLLASSIEAFRRGGRALEPALAIEATALALGQSDRLNEAKPLLNEAIEIYERLGARRDAARVGASMRSFGIRRGSRGSRGRPRAGWESLTPTEVEVVRLATQGLTNPQIATRLFVSRATVRTHLSHVFGKLGFESRVELAAEAARREL